MKMSQLLDAVKEPGLLLERGWSRAELNAMADSDTRENAEKLWELFCYAKAVLDPNPEVRTRMERVRKSGGLSEREMAILARDLEMGIYDSCWCVIEMFRDCLYQRDIDEKTLEWWYELENY